MPLLILIITQISATHVDPSFIIRPEHNYQLLSKVAKWDYVKSVIERSTWATYEGNYEIQFKMLTLVKFSFK